MDGNGRWAKNRGRPRWFGHFRGVKTLRTIVQICRKGEVPYLTVFAFSTENWKRSFKETSIILKLIQKSLIRYQKLMEENQIRLHILGDIHTLDVSFQKICQKLMEKTKNYKGLQLIVAINYGGRREIVQAVRRVIKYVQDKNLNRETVDEQLISQFLPSSVFPPPDLIIRTGAVSRLSNFYLWSAAYSEFYVSPVLWPDFSQKELMSAFHFYQTTQRRFGSDVSI